MWPQYVYIVLTLIGLGFSLAKHGQPKEENHNFFVSLISTSLIISLLYFGGFF